MGRAPPVCVASGDAGASGGSDADAPLPAAVQAYLDYVRVEKRLAERTQTLYTLDLRKLLTYAQAIGVDLLALQTAHIRRFAAQMHSSGRSARGIALILSGWRGFFQWAARQSLRMSWPPTRTVPPVGLTSPQMMEISVVLPAPLGPSRARISP